MSDGTYTKMVIELNVKLDTIIELLSMKEGVDIKLKDLIDEDKKEKTKDIIFEYLSNYNGVRKLKYVDIAKAIKITSSTVRRQFRGNPDLQKAIDDVNYQIDIDRVQSKYNKFKYG